MITALKAVNGQLLITADHGNVERMIDNDTQQPHTAHTHALVPLVYFGPQALTFKPGTGHLCDIAPTLLSLIKYPKPQAMTGHSLIEIS